MRFVFFNPLTCAAVLALTSCTDDGVEPADPEHEASTLSLSTPQTFTAFESGQVRPLAISNDRRLVYATNTPDNRVEIFRIAGRRLVPVTSVPVGLDPVALAEGPGAELWVVNHLSDSVSIVDVSSPQRAHVVRTLHVGDEPRDIVFAGRGRTRAFITTAHRGQNIYWRRARPPVSATWSSTDSARARSACCTTPRPGASSPTPRAA